jgi:hypothetical protein
MASKHPSFTNFAKGSVISEADVTVTRAYFGMFDYAGKREAVPALLVTFKTTGGDEYEQGYTVGSTDDYAPSKDGKNLDVLSDRERIHEQTNYAHFIAALLKAGFTRKILDDSTDIGCLVGTEGHVRQEAITRTGENIKKEISLLVFSKITALPGESKSSSGGGPDSSVADEAAQVMLEILSESGSVERKKLLPLVIKSATYKAMDKDTKTAVLNTIKTDEFITGGTDWSVDNTGVVSLGG